ncbi:ThiF family adenylyltransferase [Actibacterium sp. 188UL27-1]|uniref:ThiF family adenylyltransferase n=1 Tax=Actibacterium sp. 188UL27-1 TaxID=2786961 RepID=UPI00195C4E18|nr:ThiF family adenylyltransferase [Actibacterium sp. 188UL27-1]MBM7067363.1 ThiF family adenylyltransferase [Actibacterium sp. 188UL27-1]
MFTYEALTTRNIGFVTEEEQAKLRDATVFVCGTGGMGGAVIMALARAGLGRLLIADIDEFEVSNLNRQVFCTIETVGRHKAEATRDACLKINPEMQIEVYHGDWADHVTELVAQSVIVVNGTDDLGASLLLYRTARAGGKAVVDAYASPLPSVYVTPPDGTDHETRLGYPTIGTDWDKLTGLQRQAAFQREAEYVLIHSSSRHHIDLDMAGQVAAGRRSRMSFAPMVLSTGMLMAYEVIAAILDKQTATDARGWFFNPHRARVEHPRPAWLAALLRPVIRRVLARMMA